MAEDFAQENRKFVLGHETDTAGRRPQTGHGAENQVTTARMHS
jgi:hypothetical protein